MQTFFNNLHWTTMFEHWGINIVKIIVAIIAFYIVKAIGKKLIYRSFDRVTKYRNISPGRSQTLEKLALNMFSYILIFIFIIIIFGILNYPVSGLLAGAGVIGLAVGFGAQGLVSDVVTGFFILLEKQVDVGEYVTLANFDGIIEEVGLRTTQLRGFDGTLHFIPNRQIGSLSNHSRGNMRALVDIGISYDENIDEAITVIQEACDRFSESNDLIVEGPNVLGVQSLGSSDVVIRVIAKTLNMEQWGIERGLKKTIKEALDQNNIEIPYPHQVFIHKNDQ